MNVDGRYVSARVSHAVCHVERKQRCELGEVRAIFGMIWLV